MSGASPERCHYISRRQRIVCEKKNHEHGAQDIPIIRKTEIIAGLDEKRGTVMADDIGRPEMFHIPKQIAASVPDDSKAAELYFGSLGALTWPIADSPDRVPGCPLVGRWAMEH